MHPDRVLDFDVLIYVVSGSVQVVEEDQEYCIFPGELLFLKHGCHHYGTKRNPPMTSWYYFHFYLYYHVRQLSRIQEVQEQPQ